MKKNFLLLIFTFSLLGNNLLFSISDSLKRLNSYTVVKTYSKEELKETWKKYKIPRIIVPVKNAVTVYEVIYTTQWHDGTPITASGILFLPESPKKTPPMLCYHHGTQIKKERSISIENGEQAICMGFAVEGYIVCMPDYIGLGKGEKFHLYQHKETEAIASIDMMRAVRQILEEKNLQTNGKLFISGYSQGGHAAMSLHKIIQERYSQEFDIAGSSPMSGPYDLSGVQSEVMFKSYSHPGYLPYLLNSYQEAYQIIEDDISTIYQHPYDTVVRYFYNGKYEMGEINKHLPDVPKDMIKEEWIKKFINDSTFKLHEALKDNDVYNWKPEAPMQLCFCEGDEQVTYKNAIVAYNTMKQNGSNLVRLRSGGKKFDHFKCAIFSSMNTKLFFNSIRNGHKKGTKGDLFKRMLIGMAKSSIVNSNSKKKKKK